MSVSYLWVGATTPDGGVVSARLKDATKQARLVVSRDKDFSSPVYFGPSSPSSDLVVRFTLGGLDADTQYHFGVESENKLDTDIVGTFRTHPDLDEPAKFTIVASSCAGLEPEAPGEGKVAVPQRISNHQVFDTIRELDPLMFVHNGDLHYYNIGSDTYVPDYDVATFRSAINDVFAQSRQHQLYRSVATQYFWDDHDFGPNDSDSTSPGRGNVCQVYRERVPHYDLGDDAGIWQAWKIGRVQFVALDVRTYRSPNDAKAGPDKTMLGAKQKAWLSRKLASSTAKFLVLFSGSRWFDDSSPDTWDAFIDERNDLITMFDTLGWKDRMCIVSGDVHAVAMDSGGNSPGGIPLFQLASLDSAPPDEPQDQYDLGPSIPGRNQYGALAFSDSGGSLTLKVTAYNGSKKLMTHKIKVDIDD